MESLGFILVILLQLGSIRSMPADIQIDEPFDDIGNDIIDLSRFGDAIYGDPDESIGRMVSEWTPESRMNPEEMGSYFEGDILFPTTDARNGVVKESSRWKGRRVPYVIHSSVPYEDASAIEKAIAEYHAKTCIQFMPRTNEKDYISFENSATGCWSSVGRIGGKQSINLQARSCTRIGTIEHEMMHAIGFYHEQNRYDRDDFVTINRGNIKPETLPNFEKAKYGETTAYGVPYDKGSVMHYSPTAFSKNGEKTITPKDLTGEDIMGQRKGFSDSDLIKINIRYCDYKLPSPIPDYNNNQLNNNNNNNNNNNFNNNNFNNGGRPQFPEYGGYPDYGFYPEYPYPYQPSGQNYRPPNGGSPGPYRPSGPNYPPSGFGPWGPPIFG